MIASFSRVCAAGRIEERLEALVFDQRLTQLAAPFGDFDEIEDDALLQSQHQIEVAQPDVGVDQDDALTALGERRAEVGGRRRLADAALPEVTTIRRALTSDAPAVPSSPSWSSARTTMRPSRATAASAVAPRRGPFSPSAAMKRRDAQLRRREVEGIDARRFVALRTGVRDAGEPPEDQDVAGRDQLGAGVDVADDDDVAGVVERLAAAQRRRVIERRGRRVDDVQRRRLCSLRRLRHDAAHARLAALAALRDVVARSGEVGDQRARRVRERHDENRERFERQTLGQRQLLEVGCGAADRTQRNAGAVEDDAQTRHVLDRRLVLSEVGDCGAPR